MSDLPTGLTGNEVAIIGMAGRWPRAHTPAELWQHVRNGAECISHFSSEELEVSGAAALSNAPDYVRARSVVEGVELFDADFFGILPKDAALIDPQHRVFLECCWEALEYAGYDPLGYPGAIGVIAGCATNTYFLHHLCADRAFIENYVGDYPTAGFPTFLGAIADTLATRVSYKLDLRGPSFTLQSACSTSLVAVSQACQSLLSYQSDMILAGGVSITFPQKRGYRHQEGGMGSADGHCRAFEDRASGTVFGSGACVVLLKRLEDALADRDHVVAIIKGFAVNNDGSGKVGFTAPSVDGQAKVIAQAQALAGVEPASIGYLEAHGTATPLGDPIEFAALSRAFRAGVQAKPFCALGTVKRNFGHLEMAAGVTGLIAAALALSHRKLPPAGDFQAPNPNLDLSASPFYVNRQLTDWPAGETPRRAGVSAFGVGGTNAHVVLEEAPSPAPPAPPRPAHLLVLSARSAAALDQATVNLTEHLKAHPDADLGSVAYTLQAGRRAFGHRRAVACTDVADAVRTLESRDPKRVATRVHVGGPVPVVFMFPGQGSQYPGMGAGLYASEPTYRADVDACAEILTPHLGLDLREALFSGTGAEPRDLRETRLAQPALFVTGYALARLWMRWGVRPDAMIGHSVGEFVAACLADVFTLPDALAIVATRARLMQDLPAGAMLSVRLGEDEVTSLLGEGVLSLAAANAPGLSVVAGPEAAVDAFERDLSEKGVVARRLLTSHAFHSSMMDPLIGPFTEYLTQFRFRAPRLPYVSGVTGDWIAPEQATDPTYWARHFREPVRFSKGVQLLQKQQPGRAYLEVGPGRVLCTLVRQHRAEDRPAVVPSLPDSANGADLSTLLEAAGTLWLRGVTPEWAQLHNDDVRRCPLPTYPFERRRHWIDPPVRGNERDRGQADVSRPPETPTPPIPRETTTMPESSSQPTATPSRLTRLRATLIDLFQDLSGMSLAESDPSATFLEMGFDSLFLTQAAQALQAKYGLRITFRQLLDRESTLDALANFLDAKLPADAAPQPPAVPTSLPQASSPAEPHLPDGAVAAVGQTAFEAVVREQLQAMSALMAKQLEALRGGHAAAAPPAVVPAAAPAPAGPQEFKAFGPYKPVQKGASGGLSEQQSRYLEAFIKRYNAKTARSKQMTQDSRRVLADPRVVSGFRAQWKDLVYPLVTVRSKGSRLWDADGNEYVDLLNGFGPIMLGHAPDFITEAIAAQMKDGFEIGPQTPLAGEVASLVCQMTGNERVTFCNTGSEAVMAAIRVARTVTARKKVALFAGSYHGTFDEVLVKGVRRGGAAHSLPIAPGIPDLQVANTLVLDYGTPESLELIRKHAHELAAVLIEPVQSRHPNLQPVEFIREVRKITQQAEAALILDEVVTGFRSHPGGVQALFDVRADLVTYGKVIGGGLPIGVLAGRAAFMDALDGGAWQYGDDSFPEVGVTFFAGTFVRHPLALAATRAVLLHLQQAGPQLQRSLTERTAALVRQLNAAFERRGVPVKVETFASLFYFTLADVPNGSLLYYHLREKGVHLQEGFPCFLTTAHSDADLQHVVRGFEESLDDLQAGGFLNPSSAAQAATPTPAAAAPAPPPALPAEVPLTEAQMEVWLSARLGDDASCAFNESLALHLRGTLDPSALREAFARLVARHEALRCTFDPVTDRLRVHDPVALDLPLLDLSGQSPAEREATFQGLIREDAGQPFDLVNGPVFRVRLLKLEPDLHVLHVTTHHIVCDGWSTNVLLRELGQLYAAQVGGKPRDLPEPMPFRQYALDQDAWSRTPERAEVVSWWVRQFSSPVAPLELPTDRPRGSVKSFQGDTVRRRIEKATYQRIKRFGAQQGCTLFATLLAGFSTLLHRLTGQREVVVGIPAAGQSLLTAESLVGHCVNFLPLRAAFDADPSGSAALTQARTTLLDATEHQNYTFGSLVQRLGLRRDPSRLPLVEVQFNLERVGAGLEFPGLQAEVASCPKSFVNFDLFLNVAESDAGLAIDCDYNRDLFDPATIERWLMHFETLLEGMAADPRRPVSALPLVSEAERRQLTDRWNDTAAEYPRDERVHTLLAAQAARTPKAVAVVCDDRSLSYEQLVGSANRLAHFLRKRGVKRGERVAVCLTRSTDMLAGVLGVLTAGAAYVPLDPDFPSERLTSVIEDAAPILLLTQKSLAADLGLSAAQVVCLDEAWSEVEREDSAPPADDATAEDLAYVIYTSGSTGKPKGVQVTHRNVVNLLCSMAREPGLTAQDVLLAVTTLAFDIAVLELYLPLLVGGRVVVASREDATDGNRLLALLKSSQATVMQATPATWRLLLEADWDGAKSLKILCGGEALSRDLADALLARASAVWNVYGPTETTVWSAALPVEAGTGPVPIGGPIANTQLYVLDDKGQPTPVGVAGELVIGGDGVARGYWNRVELTAEKFVSDPFQKAGARMYRTGDLVRRLPDGNLEFLGRIDNQVKIRGFRIELGDVEHAIGQYPGVRECVVVAREDVPGDKRLVAYVVATPPANGGLRAYLADKLPTYMIPATFVPLDALPQTPNGKIDRRALPAPVAPKTSADQEGGAPRNQRDETLAGICAGVLELAQVGIQDDLFDLGMNSLQMFKIIARANDAGLKLTPRQIWAGRNVAAISDEMEKSEQQHTQQPVVPRLAPVSRDRYRVQRSSLTGTDKPSG